MLDSITNLQLRLLSRRSLIFLHFFGSLVVNNKFRHRSHNHSPQCQLPQQVLKQYLPNLQTAMNSNKHRECTFLNRHNRHLNLIFKQHWRECSPAKLTWAMAQLNQPPSQICRQYLQDSVASQHRKHRRCKVTGIPISIRTSTTASGNMSRTNMTMDTVKSKDLEEAMDK